MIDDLEPKINLGQGMLLLIGGGLASAVLWSLASGFAGW